MPCGPQRPTSKPKKKLGPGRPKTSKLDPTSQTRERQRRHREKKREAGRVAVELRDQSRLGAMPSWLAIRPFAEYKRAVKKQRLAIRRLPSPGSIRPGR